MTIAALMQPFQYDLQSSAAKDKGKTQGFVLRFPPQNRALATSCSHSNAICKHRFQKHPITTHTQAHPKQLEATVTMRQKKNDKPTPTATAAQTRYLSSPAAATLHGKTQGFVLRLPPQHTALATSCSHSNAI